MKTAISYQRFSHPAQAAGDSIRRQTALRDAWLARNKVRLDTRHAFKDEGKSGKTGRYSGANPDRKALASLLSLAHRGEIKAGTYLIVENLDRLTREDWRPALRLILDLLDCGLVIVQLEPETILSPADNDPMKAMMLIAELSRGNSESRMKVLRNGQAWIRKREAIGKVKMTAQAPRWLRLREDRAGFDPIPQPTATVRRIFSMACDGYGAKTIRAKFIAEKVQAIGTSKKWNEVYILNVLRSRAVLGEFQPMTGSVKTGRKPIGDVLPDYYPRIISESQFHRAQVAVKGRLQIRGRRGKGVTNLFTSLIHDGAGHSLVITEKRKGHKSLVSSEAVSGTYCSFSYDAFERSFLALIRQVDYASLGGTEASDDEEPGLIGRRDTITGNLSKIKARLDGGEYSELMFNQAVKMESELKGVQKRLDEVKNEKASAPQDAHAALVAVIPLLDEAEGAEKEKLRSQIKELIRRAVSRITCQFGGDTHRRWAQCCIDLADYDSAPPGVQRLMRIWLVIHTGRLRPAQARLYRTDESGQPDMDGPSIDYTEGDGLSFEGEPLNWDSSLAE